MLDRIIALELISWKGNRNIPFKLSKIKFKRNEFTSIVLLCSVPMDEVRMCNLIKEWELFEIDEFKIVSIFFKYQMNNFFCYIL